MRKQHTFSKFSSTTLTRNSIDKLRVNYRRRTKIRKFSLSNSVPPVWIKLSALVKNAPNVNTFKNAIDSQNVSVDVFLIILILNECRKYPFEELLLPHTPCTIHRLFYNC